MQDLFLGKVVFYNFDRLIKKCHKKNVIIAIE